MLAFPSAKPLLSESVVYLAVGSSILPAARPSPVSLNVHHLWRVGTQSHAVLPDSNQKHASTSELRSIT